MKPNWMESTLATLKAAGWCALTVLAICAAVAAIKIGNSADEITRQVNDTLAAIENTAGGIQADSKAIHTELYRDLRIIGGGATAWEKASTQQAAYWTDTARKSGEVLDAAKITLGSLDGSAKALGTLASDTDFDLNDSRTGAIPAMQYDATVLTDKLARLAESMTLLSNHAGQVVGDPEIAQSLTAMRGTADDLKAMGDDLRAKVHQMVKPASLAYRIFTGLMGGAARGAQISMGVR